MVVMAVAERAQARWSTAVNRGSARHPPQSGRQCLMHWLSLAAALAMVER